MKIKLATGTSSSKTWLGTPAAKSGWIAIDCHFKWNQPSWNTWDTEYCGILGINRNSWIQWQPGNPNFQDFEDRKACEDQTCGVCALYCNNFLHVLLAAIVFTWCPGFNTAAVAVGVPSGCYRCYQKLSTLRLNHIRDPVPVHVACMVSRFLEKLLLILNSIFWLSWG